MFRTRDDNNSLNTLGRDHLHVWVSIRHLAIFDDKELIVLRPKEEFSDCLEKMEQEDKDNLCCMVQEVWRDEKNVKYFFFTFRYCGRFA